MHELIKRIRFSWVVVALLIGTLAMQIAMDTWHIGTLSPSTMENYAFLPAQLGGGCDSVCTAECGEGCESCPPQPGVTLSILPFFAVAHLVANLTGFETDGYSAPYLIAILISSLVCLIIGLWFLHRVLTLWYPDYMATLAVLCIAFGSNLFYFFNIAPGSAHIVAFMLTSIFIYFTIQWHQDRDVRTSLILALTAGALALVRVPALWVFVFFFLYEVKGWRSFFYKMKLYRQHAGKLFVIAAVTFLMWFMVPVLCAWCSGTPLFEGCYPKGFPAITPTILGFRPGLLIYSPVLLFSLAGFFSLVGYMKKFLLPCLATVVLYMITAVILWTNQSAHIGYRTVIDMYPVLAMPFCALLSKMLNLGPFTRRLLYILLFVFIALNLYQTMSLAKKTSYYRFGQRTESHASPVVNPGGGR
jgi:hypothetical protein